jgi:hypothetical protein
MDSLGEARLPHDVATHQRAGIEHTSGATGRRYDDLVHAFEQEVHSS